MFCKKCGTELKEGAKFCPKCGTPVSAETGTQTQEQPAGVQPQPAADLAGAKAGKKIPYVAIGALVIVIIAVVLFVRSCAGGGYEQPIKNLVKGIENKNGNQILSVFSDEMLEIMEQESGYDRDEMAEMMEDMFNYDIGDVSISDVDYKMDYEIKDTLDLSAREIKNIEDELSDDGLDIDIKEGKEVELTLTISIDSLGFEQEEDMTLEVIKVGGDWYINPLSM